MGTWQPECTYFAGFDRKRSRSLRLMEDVFWGLYMGTVGLMMTHVYQHCLALLCFGCGSEGDCQKVDVLVGRMRCFPMKSLCGELIMTYLDANNFTRF